MNVYALFSDYSAAKIILDVFARREGDPLSIRSTVNNAVICKSAERGFLSALSHYKRHKPTMQDGLDIVWEFEGNPDGLNNYDGPSAGLAFFVRFLVYLHQMKSPEQPLFSAAATGELSDLTSQANIRPIKSLPEKLQAACAALSPGDKIFFPIGNSQDVDDELSRLAREKGIELIPVATVAEAGHIIDSWFESETIEPPQRKHAKPVLKKLWQPLLLLFGIIAMSFLLIHFIGKNQLQAEKVIRSIEQGEFANVALERLRTAADAGLRRVAEKASTPLRLKSNFIYLENNQPLLQDIANLSVMQNVELDSSEGYRFEVQAEKSCFMYLFQFEGNSTVELLFPASSFDLDNHYLAEQQLYLIPGSINYFYFRASEVRRVVTLYLLGSFWRARDIEKLCLAYDQTRSSEEQKRYRDRLVQCIQKRSQAIESGWMGLFFQKGYFWRH